MRIVVDFQDESLEFELPEEHLVAAWRGPGRGKTAPARTRPSRARWKPRITRRSARWSCRATGRVRPRPDDPGHGTRACRSHVHSPGRGNRAGKRDGAVGVARPAAAERPLPPGTDLVVHDPNDRGQLAYLAATKEGGGSI